MNNNVGKTINYIKRNGLVKGYYAVKERLENRKETYEYVPISHEERLNQVAASLQFKTGFSILVPAYETRPQYLKSLIDSVKAQTYNNWELIIADASKTNIVANVVAEYADPRIIYQKLERNLGISGNTNEGLNKCSKEYTGLLDHDDILAPDALYEMVSAIEKSASEGIKLKLIYSDEDKTDSENTRYFDPNIKDKFNLDLIMSNNYICHFLVADTNLLKETRFRSEYDGAQDHDVILRMVSALRADYLKEYERYIYHVPKVLYHWRCHEESTAANPQSKLYAYEAGKRAVSSFLKNEGIKAIVSDLPHLGFFYVTYKPNIFKNRKNVAAVGGIVINKKNIVVDGVYDENLNLKFEGLNKNYSGGHLHTMSCQQEVPYVNPEYMRARSKIAKRYEEFKASHAVITDKNSLMREFCDMIKADGYVFVYDPRLVIREGTNKRD